MGDWRSLFVDQRSLDVAGHSALKDVFDASARGPSPTIQEAAMSTTNDMKFEIVVIPVSDVDRAKEFYAKLGWRLDADYDDGKTFRVLQFTPPGSGCSVCVPKIRFCNIGDEGHRELGVT
jgi:hypothetical protein